MKKGKKVLIVEDEEVIRKILRLNLNKWGFEVEEAEDGLRALAKLGKELYALVICDIVMPNMDGWELIKQIKKNPKTQDVRIIALTGRNKDADVRKGYELGADYYITKPFTGAQLRYGIRMILGENPEESSNGVSVIDLSHQFESEDS
jgi:DNA-binding response OmpR family regulator